MSTMPPNGLPRPRGARSLGAAVLGTPLLWAAHLQLTYALVQPLCRSKKIWLLHVITLAFLALITLGMEVSRREWSATAQGPNPDPAGPHSRRFLAALGLMTGTLFFIVVLATGLAPLFIDPCQD
jgi:hypothetical protein